MRRPAHPASPRRSAPLARPAARPTRRAATGAEGFFVDIPFKPFPVSWQDTGSGVFTLAAAALAYAAMGTERTRRTTGYGLLAAIGALLVDIYLY